MHDYNLKIGTALIAMPDFLLISDIEFSVKLMII